MGNGIPTVVFPAVVVMGAAMNCVGTDEEFEDAMTAVVVILGCWEWVGWDCCCCFFNSAFISVSVTLLTGDVVTEPATDF